MTAATGARIVRGAAWSAAESWGRHLFSFVIVVVLARQLDAEAFGLAALAMVAPVILGVLVINGIPEALVQRSELEPIHLYSAFWLLVSVGLTASLLIWLAAAPMAWALGEPRLAELVRWTGAIVFLQSIGSVPSAVLRRHLDFRLFALRTTVGTATGGMLGIGLALAGFGVWSLVFMQIARVSVESAILIGFGNWRPRFRFSLARCRDLSGFALPLVVQSLWNLINDELPKVILGLFIGTQAVGIFAFARRPLEFLTQCFLGPVISVTMPAVSRLQGEPDRINDFFRMATLISALIGFPIFFGFAAVAPEAVPLVFGPQWDVAVRPVQLLMFLGLFRSLDSLSGLSLLALGHSRLLLKMNVLYTGFVLLVVPPATVLGVNAAVAGVVLCNLALLPIFFVLARRLAGIDVFAAMASFPRLTLSCLLMVAAIEVFRHVAPASASVPLLLTAEIALGVGTFATSALLLLRRELRLAAGALRHLRG
ncbi:MAG: lipopolysaccharide biosynthesis protein [Bauldia sp.]|nr:lipopolysaccharide biosynthesis protein [Bauldia sp.]